MTSLLVLIDRLLTINNLLHRLVLVGVFDGVCVHCAVHGQHGHESLLGFVGWVVKWIIVSLTWVSSLFGVLLVCCVGGFSEGVTPSILSEPGS